MRTDLLRNTTLAALLLAAPLALTACDKQGPAERAGEKIDDAAEKAGEKLDNARDKAGETVDELRAKADAAMEKADDKK
ncbi:hypothetical protein [Niveispirillum sp.]|uniref:hypothetical protein n=1 Tax=Niveispirillum sp. TaxID=1917217 RepID=UPI001B6A40A8|nr:hypothetical protein [Niveispirillum sp.]MBP7339440.1 hypothetical protein [Niveispirillum sp.]